MENNTQEKTQNKQENKGFITFGSSKKDEPSPEIIKLNSSISELSRRIRVLEERYSNIRKKIQVTEHNMLSIQRNLIREIKATDSQVLDLQKNILNLDEKMKQISRELVNFSPAEELKIISRYLDFWEPVGFITKREAEKLVRDIIEENRKI
jgi:predicted  nucleic acid-binding Zn-ribbon protein